MITRGSRAPWRASWLLFATLGAVASCARTDSPGGAPAASAPESAGARIYNGNCVSCHQTDGRGIPGVFPPLSGSPMVLGDPKALALWVVKGQRAASMPTRRTAASMPSFGWMKAADAAALLTYLRSSFGNSATAVEASTVGAALGE